MTATVDDQYEMTNIATDGTTGVEGSLYRMVDTGAEWYSNMGDDADNQ